MTYQRKVYLSLLLLFFEKLILAQGALNVDGNWSPWSTVSGFCIRKENEQELVECGGGWVKKYRSCTNPKPQGTGVACAGDPEDFKPCNTHPCALPSEFMWSEWTDCTSRCGRGQQRRYLMCGNIRKRLPLMTAEHSALSSKPEQTYETIPPTRADVTTTTVGVTTTAGDTTTAAGETTTGEVTTTGAPTTTAGETTSAGSTADATASTTGGSTAAGAVTTAGAATAAPSAPRVMGWIDLWELELSGPCKDQPPEEWATNENQTVRDCNTWEYYPDFPYLWNHTNCPDPCLTYKCPQFAKCDTLLSTEEDPHIRCSCQMGTVMKSDNSSCIVPPLTTPTPRPIPTLAPETKAVTGALSRSASTLIIIFLALTIGLFLIFRIFDTHRVIQMCEEISLLCAHICLMPSFHADKPIPVECRVISICIHYFYTVCFTFMLLEAVHMYSLVASVVKAGGMLSTKQNLVVGWGIPAFIVLFNMCFEYENYGTEYHCWLDMGTGLLYGQYLPIVVMSIVTFTLIEAAGAAEEYVQLSDCDEIDKTTGKISQRTLLIILPLVLASFVTGTIAEYEQKVPLYGTFTILNGVVGGVIFFFHITSHPKTRALMSRVTSKICKKKGGEDEKDQ